MHKNKLKSEIFKDKKSLRTKLFLSVLTKNLNWKSLTKNLVTFNFIMGVHLKIFLGGGVHELKVAGGGGGGGTDSFQI